MSEQQAAFDPFERVADCVYMRGASTEGGKHGFALIDADGELELFSENRSDLFFYISKHELKFIVLN